MIDRVAADLGRRLDEVPVGFKWLVDGLLDGSLGFGGEESAGASFLRRDGTVWTTDKDGIVCCLLAAEMTARRGADPAPSTASSPPASATPPHRRGRTRHPRAEGRAQAAVRRRRAGLGAGRRADHQVLTEAPSNGAALGGVKVMTGNGWFAARPSGTEDVYKVYAESFLGPTTWSGS